MKSSGNRTHGRKLKYWLESGSSDLSHFGHGNVLHFSNLHGTCQVPAKTVRDPSNSANIVRTAQRGGPKKAPRPRLHASNDLVSHLA